MADIFSTATAASAALEQCIKLYSRIRKAVERQKNLPELVDKYTAEVSQVKTTLELIEDEEALKTPSVGDAVAQCRKVGEALRTHLTKIAVTKGPVQDFVKQLVSGSRSQETLEGIMRDLESARLKLVLPMLLANVGLTRGVGEALQVHMATVESMNKLIKEKLGSDHVLRISRLLEGRPRNVDGTVTLTNEDVETLSKEESLTGAPGDGKPRATRIVTDNRASNHALQVNTPIGMDVWKDIGTVSIERNTATDHAVQWNYPIASVDAFLAALEMRKVEVPANAEA